MRCISVFGIGKLGLPLAACLANKNCPQYSRMCIPQNKRQADVLFYTE